MRFTLLLLFGIAGACAQLNAQNFIAGLGGHQEVPSSTTIAEGIVDLELDGDSLRISGDIEDLTSPIDFDILGGAHIHLGYAGENGPVLLPIEITYDDSDFSAEIVDKAYHVADSTMLLQALNSGSAYINVHTFNFPGGEVRGQIIGNLDEIDDVFDAMLYGDQQNPQVLTDGVGGITIEVTNDSLIVSGAYTLQSPLSPVGGTGIHLHTGLHGTNGPVALPLTPTTSNFGLSGTLERGQNSFIRNQDIDALIDEIEAHNVYINIHSVEHPTGEIRGQVVNYNSNIYFGYVSDNTTSANSNADLSMRIMAEKVFQDDELKVSGSFRNLDPAAASQVSPFISIRNPRAGNAGLTEFNLPFDLPANSSIAEIPLQTFTTDENVAIGLYTRFATNVGWALNSSGLPTIDDRLYHECKRAFTSVFTGSQAVPSTPSLGQGSIITEYYTSRIETTGQLTNLSGEVDVNVAGGFHIHEGLAGRAGAIVEDISFIQQGDLVIILPEENTRSITPVTAQLMKDRGLYFNVHTAEYPSGEVRGQILPRANTQYHALMTAGQAVPGYGPSPANGALIAEVYENSIAFSGSFNELTGGFAPSIGGGAHIHGNYPGRTGGIVLAIESLSPDGATEGDFFASENTFVTTPGFTDSVIRRQLYINVHSNDRPAGELRGQLTPLASAKYHGKLSTDVTVPFTGTLTNQDDEGHLNAEIFSTGFLVVSGSFNNLDAPVDTTIGGGAHLHENTVGETGGILFGIEMQLENGDSAAVILPNLNSRSIDQTVVDALTAGGIYANVHTTGAPSGAIRGQLLLDGNQYPNAPRLNPISGGMINLNSGDPSTIATIDWDEVMDPDPEHGVGYFWQLFVDTTQAPIFQSTTNTTSEISFSYSQIDSLLSDLNVDLGGNIQLFHRAVSTDGSLLTPMEGFDNTVFTRFITNGLAEFPASSIHLVNTVLAGDKTLTLAVNDLPAGRLQLDFFSPSGQRIATQRIAHSGFAQQYSILPQLKQAGMYILQVRDQQGNAKSWLFKLK